MLTKPLHAAWASGVPVALLPPLRGPCRFCVGRAAFVWPVPPLCGRWTRHEPCSACPAPAPGGGPLAASRWPAELVRPQSCVLGGGGGREP
jgi:hypothetical protein